MIDHVGLRFSDLDASARFYDTLLTPLGIERTYTSDGLIEWDDLAIGPEEEDRPVVHGLHLGFVAPSRAHVDRAWRAAVDAGYQDDGAPGPREVYGPDYYGGFLLDPDGNSAEAVHHGNLRANGNIDHLWIRVADVAASRAFYSRIPGVAIATDTAERVRFTTGGGSFSVLADDGRGLTENLHLALAGSEDDVRAFHAGLTGAGFRDNGAPGFRPQYHEGYYTAFVLDPDGNNIEVVDHQQ